MGLADDAPGTYDLTCGEANADVDPNLGVLGCTSCPKCFGELYANMSDFRVRFDSWPRVLNPWSCVTLKLGL